MWSFESRQSRRWAETQLKERKINRRAVEIFHKWTKEAKTPKEQAQLLDPKKMASASDNHKKAWLLWKKLKEERAVAMAKVKGATCPDWWVPGAEDELMDEGVEKDDLRRWKEHAEEMEKGAFGDEGDGMSVDGEGGEEEDDDEEERGVQREPPEPVSPGEFERYYANQK